MSSKIDMSRNLTSVQREFVFYWSKTQINMSMVTQMIFRSAHLSYWMAKIKNNV